MGVQDGPNTREDAKEMSEERSGVAGGRMRPRPYEKPDIKSSSIKETFLACGKCANGPIEQFFCVIFPEQS
jgi:hypothetical protein